MITCQAVFHRQSRVGWPLTSACSGPSAATQILANYGIDAVSSVAGTCILLFEGRGTAKWPRRLFQLACDSGIACLVTTLHGLTIMCQAIIYAVALNGSHNGLVALLIATQFAEIKGITHRKVDDSKLLHMARTVRRLAQLYGCGPRGAQGRLAFWWGTMRISDR